MLSNETLTYLKTLPGGDWSTDQKRQKLYELVMQCANEFKGENLLSVELGVFGGISLFSMAHAHKDLKNGFAIGIDTWDNIAPLEGTNSEANNNWWKSLDMNSIHSAFRLAMQKPEWSTHVEYLKGRTDAFMDQFLDNSVTLLHQDSNHNTEIITKELELWTPKIKMGGYLVADDVDWVEAKAGYAQLPNFGFELMEGFTTWQIWKKVSEPKQGLAVPPLGGQGVAEVVAVPAVDSTPESGGVPEGRDGNVTLSVVEGPETETPLSEQELLKTFNQLKPDLSLMVSSDAKGIEASTIDIMKATAESNAVAKCLPIQAKSVFPILLFLPDTKEWLQKFLDALIYFTSQGIHPFCVAGVHAVQWGITSRHFYMRDTWGRLIHKYGNTLPNLMPDELKNPYYIGDPKVGGIISHYILYNVMAAMPHDYFMVLEGDARFIDGWKEKLEAALKIIPPDFDFLYVGHSDAADKEGVAVLSSAGGGAPQGAEVEGLYHYPHREGKENYYPMCGHCYIVAKKALPIILATQRGTSDPVDIQLIYDAFPHLNVYAILPRLADQPGTNLNP